MTNQRTTSQQTDADQVKLPTDPHFVDPFPRTGTRKYSASELAAKAEYEEGQLRAAQALLDENARLRAIADDYEQLKQLLLGAEMAHEIARARLGQAERAVKAVPAVLRTALRIILGPDKSILVQPVDSSKPLAVEYTIDARTIQHDTGIPTGTEVTLRTKNGVVTLSMLLGASDLSDSLAKAAHQVYMDGDPAPVARIYQGLRERPAPAQPPVNYEKDELTSNGPGESGLPYEESQGFGPPSIWR